MRATWADRTVTVDDVTSIPRGGDAAVEREREAAVCLVSHHVAARCEIDNTDIEAFCDFDYEHSSKSPENNDEGSDCVNLSDVGVGVVDKRVLDCVNLSNVGVGVVDKIVLDCVVKIVHDCVDPCPNADSGQLKSDNTTVIKNLNTSVPNKNCVKLSGREEITVEPRTSERGETREAWPGLTPRGGQPGELTDNSDWIRILAPASEINDVYTDRLYCTLHVVDNQANGRVDLYIEVFDKCLQGVCDCIFEVSGATSQLRPCRVFAECFCRGDVDPDWEYILRGACFGYRVIDSDCGSSYICNNYSSITKQPIGPVMTDRLKLEIEQGLLTVVDTKCDCTHALGSVPKGHDDFRAIVDCSSPVGDCVNDHTWSCRNKFSYNSVDNVTDLLQRGDYLATVDISNAYRAVNTHPDSRVRQGLTWDFGEGVIYMRDNRLCMGLSSSPFVFSKISDFVVRCLSRDGYSDCINYLDDFCLVGRDAHSCMKAQTALLSILGRLGFFVSFKKLTPATTISKFLGIEIDSEKMELRLPRDKLDKLEIQLNKFLKKRKASKLELESLGGILAHCCKVVHGGRTFSRRVYDLMASARRNHHKVRLNEEFREDIRWWLEFAAVFNGHAKIIPPTSPAVSVYSDASLAGFGALHGEDWVAGFFGNSTKRKNHVDLGHHKGEADDKGCATDNINVLEMWPVLVGVRRWGSGWQDSLVVFVTDNTQVCAALNTGRSKNKTTMRWLRQIFWESVTHNFLIKSVYINTHDNIICDSLSRLDCYKNIARVRDADVAMNMCCHHIFHC